ncbi:unnamed protein product, partial [Gadus morhua 'NCC']
LFGEARHPPPVSPWCRMPTPHCLFESEDLSVVSGAVLGVLVCRDIQPPGSVLIKLFILGYGEVVFSSHQPSL